MLIVILSMMWSINIELKEFQWKTGKILIKCKSWRSKEKKETQKILFYVDLFCQWILGIEKWREWKNKTAMQNAVCTFFSISKYSSKPFTFGFLIEINHWQHRMAWDLITKKPSIDFKQKMEVVSDCPTQESWMYYDIFITIFKKYVPPKSQS